MSYIEIDPVSDMPDHTFGGGQTKSGDIKSLKLSAVATADDNVLWAEPATPTHSQYPFNKAEQTVSGHVFEVDDTPGAERIMNMHKSGTFEEIHASGDKVIKIFGDGFEIILKDRNMFVGGALNITVMQDCNLLVKGNMNQKVDGNYNLTVNGNMTQRVKGTTTLYSKDSMTVQTANEMKIRSTNSMNIQTDKQFTARASSTMSLWADARMFIDGSRVDFNLKGPNPAKLTNIDPGSGLTLSKSLSQPSPDVIMILRTDNNALNTLIDTSSITYPKDRVKNT